MAEKLITTNVLNMFVINVKLITDLLLSFHYNKAKLLSFKKTQ